MIIIIYFIIFIIILTSLLITIINFLINRNNNDKCPKINDCSKCSNDCSKCSKINDCSKCSNDCSKCSNDCSKCSNDCSKCTKTNNIKVGDQVYFESNDGAKIGCVKNINSVNEMADVCTFYSSDCAEMEHAKISSFYKTSKPHTLPCDYRWKECNEIPNICKLHNGDYYPGNNSTQFDTKEKCENYFGTDNTWGKCVEKKILNYKYWSLGCNYDDDCGNGRKCLDDGNPLNQMDKICTCNIDDDCNFKGSSGESYCGGDPGIIGKTTCPK
jgi:hypothetical protein